MKDLTLQLHLAGHVKADVSWVAVQGGSSRACKDVVVTIVSEKYLQCLFEISLGSHIDAVENVSRLCIFIINV